MTRKEMNLAVFTRDPLPHVFFQPRFEPWFDWQRQFGRLPDELAELSLPQAYDLIGASMRTVHYYTGQPGPIDHGHADDVKITTERQGGIQRTRFDTPHGPLFEAARRTVDGPWRTVEFAAKSADDLPALLWLAQRCTHAFSVKNYRIGSHYLGDRGEPGFWVPKSPYLALAQTWFKYEDFIYALADRPSQIHDIMRAIDDTYDAMYEQLTSARQKDAAGRDVPLVRVINFGENVAVAHMSARYFEEYLLPWYHKRAGQLSRAGMFTHIHIDGCFKPLMRFFPALPFDGLEALTPKPQGDVTLEEIREHIGDKVLLDGIPAVLFLEHHPREQLQACVEQIVRMFHPRLVLGVSDELPEAGGVEAWERLKWVADYARMH